MPDPIKIQKRELQPGDIVSNRYRQYTIESIDDDRVVYTNNAGWDYVSQVTLISRPTKVTVAQIREFVYNFDDTGHTTSSAFSEILDFIDNGPKKPTAEEVVHSVVNHVAHEGCPTAKEITDALREAGYLREDT